MADPKGFLTTPRQPWPRRSAADRVADWNEVNEVYTGQSLLPIIGGQAGRCMDCGIPFCHDACPLGNLVPDWNDLVFREGWQAAAERLLATNNFPEFTGRLCPAPCESACVLAIDSEPVTIKNIEAAIAERAWQLGCERPLAPLGPSGRSVAIVGSGPAGLACAQQLTRAGHRVAVYERADRIGGLLRYGIPGFRLEKRQLDRRIEQLRLEGTEFHTGVTVGVDLSAAELRARHDALVLAVGATCWRELPVPGRELNGVHQAMEYLPLANRVLEGDFASPAISARGKQVVIVGGGDTAADCLGTALRQQAAGVTQLDINPRPGERRTAQQPWPVHPKTYRMTASHEEAQAFTQALSDARSDARQGWDAPVAVAAGVGTSVRAGVDARIFSAATLRLEGGPHGNVASLHLAEAQPPDRRPRPGSRQVIPADLVLIALGFCGPEADSPLVEELALEITGEGTLARDGHFATELDGVFVAGDAGRGQSLIVWAIAEGRSAAAAVDRYLTGSTALPAPIAPTDRPLAV
ncbi:glutamate synthase subunit beta [Kitasatospora kifunensis]|uniref:Glutamate synthase (NADPH/NADH) small chain n=1 Tax=Kitasatospora kifunensis TaxID=58351 RepID=A0A7W7VSK8_KITKI|nr:glutamate synthase subunit beta [Kitasatospora kifunensis]MBB4921252.1 glutamate synthase (NADPH/NADH) small chain [Kitasatospora kifunensis]